MSEISDRITRGKENDYTPVNQYIDEQSRLRRARSFWIREIGRASCRERV